MSLWGTIKKKATTLYNKAVKATTPKKAVPKPVAKKAPTPAKKPAPKKVATPAKKPVTPQPSVMDKVQATAGKLGNYMKSNVQAKQAERNTGKFMVPTKKQVASNNATMDMLNLSTLAGAGVYGAKTGGKGVVNKVKGAVKGVAGLHKDATKNYLKYGTGKYSTAADVISKNTTGKALMDKSNQKNYKSNMLKGTAVDLLDPASALLGGVGKVAKGVGIVSKGSKITKAVKGVDKAKDAGKQLGMFDTAKAIKPKAKPKKAPASAIQEIAVTSPGGYRPTMPTAKVPGAIPSPLPGRANAAATNSNIAARGKGYMPAAAKQVGNANALPTPRPPMNTPKSINMPAAKPPAQMANNLPVPTRPQYPAPRPPQMPAANPGAINGVANIGQGIKGGNYVIDGDRQMRAGAGFMDEAAQYGQPNFTKGFGATNPVPPRVPNINLGAADNAARGLNAPPQLGQLQPPVNPGMANNIPNPGMMNNVPNPGMANNIPTPNPGQLDNMADGLDIVGNTAPQAAAKSGLPSWAKPVAKGAAITGAVGVGGAYLLGGDGGQEQKTDEELALEAANSGGRSGGRSGGSGGSGGPGGAANTGMPSLDATPVDQAAYMQQVQSMMDSFMKNDPVLQGMLGQLPNGGTIGQDMQQNPANPQDPNAPQKPTTGYQPPNLNWDAINNAVNTGGMTVEQATAQINEQLKPQYETGTNQIQQTFAQRKQALMEDLASRGLLNSGVAAQLQSDLMKMEADSLAAFTAEHNGKVLDYAMQNMQLDQQKTEQLQQLYMAQKQVELDSYFKQMDYSLNLQQLSQQQNSMYLEYYQNMKMYAFQTMMDMVKKSMPDYNYYVSQKTSGGNYNFNYN